MIFRCDEKKMGVRLDAKSATTPRRARTVISCGPLCHHPSHSAVYRRFRATVRHPRASSRRVVQGSVNRRPCRSLFELKIPGDNRSATPVRHEGEGQNYDVTSGSRLIRTQQCSPPSAQRINSLLANIWSRQAPRPHRSLWYQRCGFTVCADIPREK